MKDLCKAISMLTASVLLVWTIFKLADRFCNRFRKTYITLDSEQIHV